MIRLARALSRWALTVALIGGSVAVGSAVYLHRAGTGLFEAATPEPSALDTVFTFDSGAGRIAYSRELAERFAARWIVSDSKHALASRGLLHDDDPDVDYRLHGAHSTWREVLALRRALDAARPSEVDVALVSDAYHMRRVRLAAERAFRGTSYRLHFLSVPERIDPVWSAKRRAGPWWADLYLRRETLKNLYYALGGYHLPIGQDS